MAFAQQSHPVAPAFARRARSVGLLVLLFASTLFAVFSHGLLSDARDDNLRSTTELLASSLRGGTQPQNKETITRVVSEQAALLAVATLDTFGLVSSIYPDRPEYRDALSKLLSGGSAPARMQSPTDGTPCVLSAVAVPFGDKLSAKNATLVAILRVDSPTDRWLTAISMFTILVAAVAWYATGSLYRWFDRQIVGPLRRLADLVADPECDSKRLRAGRFSRWSETAQIASHFQELRTCLEQSFAQAKRYRDDAQRTMRDREIGFDRELQHARFLAQTDPLTQLRNRAFLDEHLESVFEAQRGLNAGLSAVMVDLDNFKAFNDTLGHQVGDALLKFAGALLNGSIRPADYAVRYGGDEFLLLLPGTDARQAAAIVERIIRMFGQYTKTLEKGDVVSMSAGVASIPEQKCLTGHELIATADRALYFAKRGGKSNVQVAPDADPIIA